MHRGTRDQVYKDIRGRVDDFTFDRGVANVFDDMVQRSVPFYAEIQRMVRELVTDFGVAGTRVYDLGCSTGTTLLQLDEALDPGVSFVGVDNAEEMLAKCREKMRERATKRSCELRRCDLDHGVEIDNASAVLMILTLQFIRPLNRDRLIAEIHRGLNDKGCFILVEKVLGEDSLFNRLFIEHYYDMKRRNGYSDTEIAQKREALENVLVPYKLLENRELLLRTGFRYADVFFKWYNFCGMVAVK